MEEKKFNNAIEKAEHLSEDTKRVKKDGANTKKTTEKGVNTEKTNKAIKSTSSSVKSEKGKSGTALAERSKKDKALIAKQKREEAKAKERVLNAEAKQKKKEQKKQAELAKKQAKMRKKESLKQMKLEKKAQKQERRDMLKHESKEQRAKRKQSEKQARLNERRAKREQRAIIKREKRQAKVEMRAQRAQERREKRSSRQSRGLGGWLAAVISLGTVSLVLATVLVWNNFMSGSGENMLTGVYSRSFYGVVEYVDNLDVNLAKLSHSNDSQNTQKILLDIIVQANLAENELSVLPLEEQSRHSTEKYMNQLGDFSKYLNNKLIEGDSLDKSDYESIEEFKKINGILKKELDTLASEMGCDFDFISMLSGEEDNAILQKFSEIEYNSVEYPKMIYDGPFADKREKASCDEHKKGEKISEEQAVDIFNNVFAEYGLEEVTLAGVAENECYKVYNVQAITGGEDIYAQISEFGEVVLFDMYNECGDINYTRDECIERATEFLNKLGYKWIKPVWTSQNNGTVYINFAAITEDKIILYPDLIKVSVCMDSGVVCDMDAKLYIDNHTEREVAHPKLRVEQAEQNVSKDIMIEASRLALIPLSNGKEKLAYEFYGSASDGTYYVYIDALTGHELQIFKVVETEEGTLLL